jgi:nucleoid-associated protein YgaU
MLDEDERTATPPKTAVSKAKPEPARNPFAALAGSGGGEKKDGADAPKPEIPETYTVEEGDTLMRISAKFYGTNRKWREIREANKTVISPDGRVRAGQVIKLP